MSSQAINTAQQKGFTLIELMTTVAIIGISLGIGVPNLQNLMQDNHQVNAINEFSSYVSFARNEAVVRNTTVKLCVANADQSACSTDETNWANGYLVIAESDNTVIKIHDQLPGNQIISGNSTALVFSPNGMLTTSNSLRFCDDHNNKARNVNINIGSQVRLVNTATIDSCSSPAA